MSYLKIVPELSGFGAPVVLTPVPVYGGIIPETPWSTRRKPMRTSRMYAGFGVEVRVPFFNQPTRELQVSSFITALQRALGVTQTGKWNEATHNALEAYLATVHAATCPPETCGEVRIPLGAWGDRPAAAAGAMPLLLLSLAAPGAWTEPSVKAAVFADAFGIPATNALEMLAWLNANKVPLSIVMPFVAEEITVAETGKCSSWLTTGLIGAGALLVGTGIGYLVWGRK